MREMEDKKDASDRLYEASAPSAVAKRAIFNSSKSGKKNFLGSQELINDIENKNIKISEIKKEEDSIGHVSSGTFSPTFKKGIGLGFVKKQYSEPGTEMDIIIRNKPYKAKVVKKPFFAYKR